MTLKLEELQEAINYYYKHLENGKAAADELGIKYSTFTRHVRIAKEKGISPDPEFMPGVSGTSTLYDAEGNVKLRWVKEQRDKKNKKLMMEAMFNALKDELEPYAPVPAPKKCNEDLLTTYMLTDYHIGMLSERYGEPDWNIDIAERMLSGWIDATMAASPDSEQALFVQCGDLMHYDSLIPVTPANKHVLDAACGPHTMVKAATRVMRRSIDTLLKKHKRVQVIVADANHDEYGAIWLREALTIAYENEPRVTIDQTEETYYAYEWGNTSLFFHHGHKRKMADISRVFAGVYREVFGRTKYSFGHIGHFHHEATHTDPLMKVTIHPTLAAPDDYAKKGGWNSRRAANAIYYSKKFGYVGESSITPQMIMENWDA
jgi:hypothetical protein